MRVDILIKNVDTRLLREQRDYLLKILRMGYTRFDTIEGEEEVKKIINTEEIEGLINMLDTMVDVAEESLGGTNGP